MTPSFSVHTTPRFDRLLKKLEKKHQGLADYYADAIEILKANPFNSNQTHHVIKLEGIPHGKGQYRFRLGRWRFRYDIFGREVWLFYCGLRREDTYR